jgi:molybdenum cofactor cytidylyltransferase
VTRPFANPDSAGPDSESGLVAAVVLAAGSSRRMGDVNKLLVPVAGMPMVARVVHTLVCTGLSRIAVVTGHDAERVRTAVQNATGEVPGCAIRFVHNPEHARGMSTSLRAGIAAIEPARAALICLADMPWVRPEHVRALVDGFAPERGHEICVPVYRGVRGNPVLLSTRFFAAVKDLQGDRGARSIIAAHDALVHRVTIPDSGVVRDVDTPDSVPK